MLAMVFVIVIAAPVAASSPNSLAGTPLIHCSLRMAPNPLVAPAVINGAVIQEALIVESRCFGTFAEALNYGSGGSLQVPAGLQPNELTASMATSSSTSAPFLLGINFSCRNYETGLFCPTWSHFASSDCTPTSGWQIADFSQPEEHGIESSKGFSGCHRTRHFEVANFLGPNLLCQPNCSTLGVLNNYTDSIRWWG